MTLTFGAVSHGRVPIPEILSLAIVPQFILTEYGPLAAGSEICIAIRESRLSIHLAAYEKLQ
jgi:hypothetical protein